jgi:hypothetical protein
VPLPLAVRGKSAMVRLQTQDGEEKLIMQALGS